MQALPRKLKKDPIVESVFEVRFTSDEPGELTVGKLAGGPLWNSFEVKRLPLADFPAPIRTADPNLMYQPVLELRGNKRAAKIGERVFSYHVLSPYPGWEIYQPELSEAVDFVFSALKGFAATRLGLRYINTFTLEHFVKDISSLNMKVSLAGDDLLGPLNLNYRVRGDDMHEVMVRIATPEFLTNPTPGVTTLVDIDVFTPKTMNAPELAKTKSWINTAHDVEKAEFFRLFTKDLMDKLAETKEKANGRHRR